jgi:hypothetical protein
MAKTVKREVDNLERAARVNVRAGSKRSDRIRSISENWDDSDFADEKDEDMHMPGDSPELAHLVFDGLFDKEVEDITRYGYGVYSFGDFD